MNNFLALHLQKILLSLFLFIAIFLSPCFAVASDTLSRARPNRQAELLEDGTYARAVHTPRPSHSNFWGVGIHYSVTTMYGNSSLMFGEIVYWHEWTRFRLGGCIDMGAAFYSSQIYFSSGLVTEAYYLTPGLAAFYVGGGVGMIGIYVRSALAPLPVLRTGFGLELFRDTRVRMEIGPTLDLGFVGGNRGWEGLVPVLGFHVRFVW